VARQYGQTALEPGGFISSPLEAISLGLAFIFGVAGLPHILVRFYTVPDAKAARNSVFYSTGIVGFFFCIIPIVGFGASALIPRAFIGGMDRGGGNMAAPLLSEYLGNTAFLGFIAAVAFATILAVVAGLTLANASSVAHDLYNNVIKQGKATSSEQMRVAKIATLVFGALAVGLGVLFEGQNVAFMATIAFAVACSANFPALFMAIMWRRFTTQGAVASILVGAFSSLIMILLSPTVYVNVFQAAKLAAKLPVDPAPISLINPAIVTMPLAILAGVLVSLLTKDPEAIAKFDAQLARNYMGVGAE
jgi:cation/acetate symporter